MELDRRVRRGREPFAQGEEPVSPPPLSVEKSERLSALEEKLKNLLLQLEVLGEDGKVDDTLALVKQVPLFFPCSFFFFDLSVSCNPKSCSWIGMDATTDAANGKGNMLITPNFHGKNKIKQ